MKIDITYKGFTTTFYCNTLKNDCQSFWEKVYKKRPCPIKKEERASRIFFRVALSFVFLLIIFYFINLLGGFLLGEESVSFAVDDVVSAETYVVIADNCFGDVSVDYLAVRIVRDGDISASVDEYRSTVLFLVITLARGKYVVLDGDALSRRHCDAIVIIGVHELIADYLDVLAGKRFLGYLYAARKVTETLDGDGCLGEVCLVSHNASRVVEETAFNGDVGGNCALSPRGLYR